MLPYPEELRMRVVAAVEQGEHSIPEVAALFGVGVTFVKKMLRLYRAGESLAPRHGGGAQPALQAREHALLRAHVSQRPDISLAELQQALARKRQITVSPSTLSRTLTRLQLPRKKRV